MPPTPMQQFLENNWLSILSILIGILVAYVFYRLQKKDSASASAERKKHATNELLDVVESYIINKQKLSEPIIENLIHASERDHFVALRPECTSISLLQDVALRLQRSRHLDIPQKSEYSEKIEQLIRDTREDRSPTRLEDLDEQLSLTIKKVRDLIPEDRAAEREEAVSLVTALVQRQRHESLKIEKSKEQVLALTTALLGVSAALATTFVGSKLFESIGGSAVSTVFSKIFPLLGVVLALAVAMTALTTVMRITRRKREALPRESPDP